MHALHFLKPLAINGKIRLGGQQDGGYVVYGKTLHSADRLLTYGVGWETLFEEEFQEQTGKKVLMFDPTMYGKYMVNFKHLGNLLLRLRLINASSYLWLVGKLWRQRRMLEKKQVFFINEGLGPVKKNKLDTLAAHQQRFQLHNEQVLLKIDIEGSEYAVFNAPDIMRDLQNVNQLLIEWHDLKNRLLDMKKAIAMLQQEFELVHIHGNNYAPTFFMYGFIHNSDTNIAFPDVLETTFVRRSCIDKNDLTDKPEAYPVEGLDFPNNPHARDIAIEFI